MHGSRVASYGPDMRTARLLALVSATALLSACASLDARSSGPPGTSPDPYEGTSANAAVVGSPSRWDAALPLHLVDLPLSAVLDTLLLPFDLYAQDDEPDLDPPE